MKIRLYRWLVVIFLPVFIGCYPEGASTSEEYDLVYTNYFEGFAFSNTHTFALPDSVIKITGDVFNDPDGDHKPQFVSAAYSTTIVNQIKQNMVNYGWTQVDKNNNPDVIILPSAMTTTNIYYYYDWAYWGWWYPYWDPWYGWYYPGSYYPSYVSGYTSGSVFIQMLDHTGPTPPSGDNIPVIWSCILNGLAEGSTASISARLQTNIDKAFSQSPYLKH